MPISPPIGHVVGGGLTPVPTSTIGNIPRVTSLTPPQTQDSVLRQLAGAIIVGATDPDGTATETFRTQGGLISSKAGFAGSVIVGKGASVANADDIALGRNAATILSSPGAVVIGVDSSGVGIIVGRNCSSLDDHVVVGQSSSAGSFWGFGSVLLGNTITLANGNGGATGGHILIGRGAGSGTLILTTSDSIAIGANTTVRGSGQLALGVSADCDSGDGAICIGPSARCLGGFTAAIVIGTNSQVQHAGCIVMGQQAITSRTNQFVVGGSGTLGGIVEVLIGKGDTSAAPQTLTYRQTNASAVIDLAAGDCIVQPGLSRGAAAPGAFIVKTGATLASGAVLQTAVERVRISDIGLTVASGWANPGGGLLFASMLSPAQIVADQNNYNPAGLLDAATIRINSDAARSITGLMQDGNARAHVKLLVNVGAFNITLVHNSGLSTAGNRFFLSNAASRVLLPQESVMLFYDTVDAKWRTAD